MAKTKWATLRARRVLDGGLTQLVFAPDEAMDWVAGNYLIVRTTLPNPAKPGDVHRRAYSLAALPDADGGFELLIQSVGERSAWMSELREGARLEYSGPWGKFFKAQATDPWERVCLVATGSGISPIQAMAQARVAGGQAAATQLWWRSEGLGLSLESLRADGLSVVEGEQVCEQVPADPKALYFLAGDGAALIPLCARLQAAGVPSEQLRVEYFFNRPPKEA
ncbi:MAG: hypothetical protein ACI9VR_005172 [Cognaticolwellia sp.]|jgi:hypothetical protein